MANQKNTEENKNPQEKKAKTKKVEITSWALAGKYNLPYNFGQKVTLDAKLAKELIDNGDAK